MVPHNLKKSPKKMNAVQAITALRAAPMTDADRAATIRATLTGHAPHSFVSLFRAYLQVLWGVTMRLPFNKTPAFYDELLSRPFSEWKKLVEDEVFQDRGNDARVFKYDQPLDHFKCAISQELPVIPVGTPDGRIYNLPDIMQWLHRSSSDPLMRGALYTHDLVGFTDETVLAMFNDKVPRNEEERDLQATWRAARGELMFKRRNMVGGALVHHVECLRFMVEALMDAFAEDWYCDLACCTRAQAIVVCDVAREMPEFRERATACLGILMAQRVATLPRACLYFDVIDNPRLKFKALVHFFNMDEEETGVRDQLVRVAREIVVRYPELTSETEHAFLLVAECAFEGKWGVTQNFGLSRSLLEKVENLDVNLQCMLAFMYVKGLGGCVRRAYGFNMLEEMGTEQAAHLLREFDRGADGVHWGANPAEVRREERRRGAEKRRELLIPPLPAPRRQRVDSGDVVV